MDRHDEDTPSKRDSHFNLQRSSLRSSQSSPIASRSRPTSIQRLDDFNLGFDRADSETLPSPVSPAPNVPYTRSTRSSTTKGKGRSRAYSSKGRGRSTPDEARRLEQLLAPESWSNPYDLLDIPLEDLGPKEGSRVSRPRAGTPGSQLDITALPSMTASNDKLSPAHHQRNRVATELYTVSYLIFFAILGTLARLGLQALTFYPGAPVAFSELWANVGGTFIIGFLSEDRRLFHAEWGRNEGPDDEERVPEPVDRPAEYHAKEKKRHAKVKKTIPLYIGLATGFCGSFTSYSSFMRDVFLALSSDLPTPLSHPHAPGTLSTSTVPRNRGYSVLALLAIILTTLALCSSALKAGAHLAASLSRVTPILPFRLTRRFLDPLIVFLGWGCWIGAILLTILPPTAHPKWRTQVLFALVFAPPGCLARYYISVLLNPIAPTFPLGTFTANIFGTAVLGMAYDLQRVRFAGASVIGCQVLQGIQDGFCGCLTTVSTWVLELDGLKRRQAYVYGVASVGVGVGLLVAVMGGVRWSAGWDRVLC